MLVAALNNPSNRVHSHGRGDNDIGGVHDNLRVRQVGSSQGLGDKVERRLCRDELRSIKTLDRVTRVGSQDAGFMPSSPSSFNTLIRVALGGSVA